MSWKKYFTPVNTGNDTTGNYSPINGQNAVNQPGPARSNYSSYLPDVYTGTPNRIDRYGQYNTMDSDSEVNAALDILAEFCTQKHAQNGTHFTFNYHKSATNAEVQILGQYLKQWYKLNNFEKRMFRLVRNVFKYGDGFFLRDPETKKLYHVDPAKVHRIIVNESEGKTPEQYIVKDIQFNFRDLVATKPHVTNGNITGGGAGYQTGGARGMVGNVASQHGNRFTVEDGEVAVAGEHMFHLSLSEGLDNNYPFGNSLLESIFKVYKQKELLEDAIIIYRVQRAPERRVFYIDVGSMPSHMAMAFVERVKNEVHQRRIPTQTGGGSNMMDATYNPLSINEDYFFPQTAEGRGSKVETLPGGTNLGEIDDLRFFTNKMFRGLRIPSSYLPTGPEDGSQSVTDGKVGTALIQEWRFNQYCKRLQKSIVDNLDNEFKMFLRWRGFNIDSSLFELRFNEPQNFASYKQAEVDSSRIAGFTQLEQYPYLSKRFLLQRYLGLSEEEMQENEEMWKVENNQAGGSASAGLRSVGITPGAIDGDIDSVSMPEPEGDAGAGELDLGAAPEQGASTSPIAGNTPEPTPQQ